MKIIEIISSLSSGGAERFVVNLSNQLTKEGHEMIICTLNDNEKINFNKQFMSEQIGYHSFQVCGKNILTIWHNVYKYLLKEKPDVIHCHLAVLQYVFPFCLFHHRVKMVHTIHSMPKYASGGTKWHARLFKLLYKTELAIPVSISEECHQGYREFYHLTNDTVIDNGVPQVVASCNIDIVRKEVEKYKTCASTKVFTHVARCHEQKQQHILVEAFNRLDEEGIDFTLLIIGAGFDSVEGMELQRFACDKIHFLGEKSNVGDYLQCSDYFCLSSRNEGLPISLLEAMSVGVIPICTPVGGMKNVINHGVNGFLSTAVGVDEFLTALQSAMDKFIDKNVIINSYKRYYSMEKCAKRYVELFGILK